MRPSLAIVVGSVSGLLLYTGMQAVLPELPVINGYTSMNVQFTGTVATHDSAHHLLRIHVPDNYTYAGPPIEVEFSYDNDTQWAATEFTFNGDLLVYRHSAIGNAITLPPGTIVSIMQDPWKQGGYRALSVTVAKRISL